MQALISYILQEEAYNWILIYNVVTTIFECSMYGLLISLCSTFPSGLQKIGGKWEKREDKEIILHLSPSQLSKKMGDLKASNILMH